MRENGAGKSFLASFFFGAVGFLLASLLLKFWAGAGASQYKILADAALFPSVILIGAGAVLSLVKIGFFDIFGYAFSRISLLFAPLPRAEISYYEYKAGHQPRGYASLPFCLSGALFLLLSLAFTLLFYRA